MPASPEEIAEAEQEGTKITCGYGPKEFLSEDGHVTAVVLKKCTGLYNAEGRFAPTYDENDTITLPCDNVVLSIGQCIEWGDLLNGEAVQLGPRPGRCGRCHDLPDCPVGYLCGRRCVHRPALCY